MKAASYLCSAGQLHYVSPEYISLIFSWYIFTTMGLLSFMVGPAQTDTCENPENLSYIFQDIPFLQQVPVYKDTLKERRLECWQMLGAVT